MALASKKQSNIIEKTDTNSKFFITGSKITEMSASFAQADHIQASHYFEENKAILYQLNQMQEEIDELRRYVTNEATGSAVKSIKFVNASDLPTSSKSLASGLLYVDSKDGNKLKKA
jgi:hypothetical protein